MTQNIKNFIEKSDKEILDYLLSKESYDLEQFAPSITLRIKLSQTSLIKMIVEDTILELGKINFLEDITGEENRKLTLERYRKFKDTISSKLKTLTDGK